MPEGDRWQQYLREWRRLPPEGRRAAILELSEADREAFRAVLANRRPGTLPPGVTAGPGAAEAAPSRLPILLGLLVLAVLAFFFVRGRQQGPGGGAAAGGDAVQPDAAGRIAPSPSRAAPGVTELVTLLQMCTDKTWRTFDGGFSPIRWTTARPVPGEALMHRAGEVRVTVNGGVTNRGLTPWDVVLWGPTPEHVSRVAIDARESSPDLMGFRLWRYLQGQGFPIVKHVRCPHDAHPATWLSYTFGRPLSMADVSECDGQGCRVKIWMYLDEDVADNIPCESPEDRENRVLGAR